MTYTVFFALVMMTRTSSTAGVKAASDISSSLNDTSCTTHQVKFACTTSSRQTVPTCRRTLQICPSVNNTRITHNVKYYDSIVNVSAVEYSDIDILLAQKLQWKKNIIKTKSSPDAMSVKQEYTSLGDSEYNAAKMDKRNKNERLYRREATDRKYRKTGIPADKLSLVSDLFPILYYDKTPAIRQAEAAETYAEVSQVDDTLASQILNHVPHDGASDHDNIYSMPIESMEQIDLDFDQALDLLRYYINVESSIDCDKVNVSLLLDKLKQLKVPYQKNINNILRSEHFKNSDTVNNRVDNQEKVLVNFSNIVSDSSIRDLLLQALTEPVQTRFVDKDFLSASDLTYPDNVKTVKKKSREPLLENPQSLVFTESDTCNHHIETKLLALPGCVPKSVLITRCHGMCHSRSVPEWDLNSQDIREVEHCTCCSAFVMKSRTLRFQCPRRPQGVLVMTLGFPFRCACRPCASVPEVTAQQPYDY